MTCALTSGIELRRLAILSSPNSNLWFSLLDFRVNSTSPTHEPATRPAVGGACYCCCGHGRTKAPHGSQLSLQARPTGPAVCLVRVVRRHQTHPSPPRWPTWPPRRASLSRRRAILVVRLSATTAIPIAMGREMPVGLLSRRPSSSMLTVCRWRHSRATGKMTLW